MKRSHKLATVILVTVGLAAVTTGTLATVAALEPPKSTATFVLLTPSPTPVIPAYLLNSRVTQSTIQTTICRSGYTSQIRPSSYYTTNLKIQQISTQHLTPTDPSQYEEDHWIPLELGGNPTEPRNLWPELWPDARNKDKLETSLKRQVCSSQITLAYAQQKMYAWKK